MLTNALDSRAIGFADAYGQRFMRTGSYRYNVMSAGLGDFTRDLPYSVDVSDGDVDSMRQTTIMLTHDGRAFHPDSDTISIEIGDLVTWACRQSGAPAFEVVGFDDFFRSARLLNESGYGHAFGTAGEIEWVDAYGSGLSGLIRIHQPGIRGTDDVAAWQEHLASGVLVMISGAEAEPNELDIVVGQTVYFAVTKAPGVSITDRRVVDVMNEMRASRNETEPP